MPECVKCGYCCAVRVCSYGLWDSIKKQCTHLTDNKLCGIYAMIIEDPNSWSSPAFGAECSSPLFNVVRAKKIAESMKSDHEFPWIYAEMTSLICTRCGASGEMGGWLEFLNKHGKCGIAQGKPGANEK